MELYTPKYNEKKIKELELALSEEVHKTKSFIDLTVSEKSAREKFLVKNMDLTDEDFQSKWLEERKLLLAKFLK